MGEEREPDTERADPVGTLPIRDPVFLALLLLAGALLLLPNLGDRALWQDEAETALLARSIATHGVPTAFDGRNLVSQEQGAEFAAPDYTWRWTPWLQHYLAAGSLAAFGETAAAARLPFALLGLACLIATWALALRTSGDRRAARIAALLLLASVPFLLHMRQCRYYAPAALFCVLSLHAYLGVLAGHRRAPWLLAACLVGLFHSQYVLCAALGAGIALHAALFARGGPTWRRLALGGGLAAVLCAPWLWVFGPHTSGAAFPGAGQGLRSLGFALDQLQHTAFPAVLLPAALAFRASAPGAPRPDRSALWLLPIVLAVATAVLAFAMPYFFFRYYLFAIPLGAALQGVVLGRLSYVRPVLAIALVAVALTTDWLPRALPLEHELPRGDIRYLRTGDEDPGRVVGAWARFTPLAAYVYEITHEIDGPLEAVARRLAAEADAEDTIVATYGDLPLQFHTPLRVVGGLSGAEIPDAPEWILVRAHTHRRADAQLARVLHDRIDWGHYERLTLDVLDVPFEHRPDPAYHKFRTVREGVPPVRLFRRRTSASADAAAQ